MQNALDSVPHSRHPQPYVTMYLCYAAFLFVVFVVTFVRTVTE